MTTFKAYRMNAPISILSAASGERSCVLVGDDEGKVRVLTPLETGKNLYFQEYHVPIKSGVFAHNGKWSAVLDKNGKVYRFEVPDNM